MILEAANIKKYYYNNESVIKAVDGINFNVEKGDFIAVMGQSGSGKSTLLNCLATLIPIDSGELIINGKRIDFRNRNLLLEIRRHDIGYIFQEYNLLEHLTVEENMILPLTISGKVGEADLRSRVEKLAGELGIGDFLHKYPGEISGGQKQRCACGRALITSPQIVFADEPTGALDSKSSEKFLELIYELNKNLGTTIIMATHNIIAASYTKRTVFLKDGKIVEQICKQDGHSYKDSIVQTVAYN